MYFICTDEIMQQEIRPLVAVDIIEQLHRQFAILSGNVQIHLHFKISLVWQEGASLGGFSLLNLIRIILKSQSSPGFPGGKVSACNAGDLGSIPRWGRSPREGNGNPLWSSCLENSIGRGAC